MQYASIVQGIGKYSGDTAVLEYDVKFRQYHEDDPKCCLWEDRHTDLFQEAMMAGISCRMKSVQKQPFRSPSASGGTNPITRSYNYCFSYNNNGS